MFDSDANQPEKLTATYSLSTLMKIVTGCSILLGIYPLLGPNLLILVPVGLLIYLGVLSHRAESEGPFWQSVTAGVLLLLTVTNMDGRHADESEVCFFSTLFVIGMWFSYRALIFGHWSTKIPAILVFLPYFSIFLFVLISGIERWDMIVKYWCSEA